MTLSQSRDADRRQMADKIFTLATAHGYHVTVSEATRCILLPITMPRGLRLTVEFDGKNPNGPHCWVLPWHMNWSSKARLAKGVLGDVNPHHFQKCTHVIDTGFDDLMEYLRASFVHVTNGTAFTS